MALTQNVQRAGGFMVSEANGFRARGGITLVTGQNLLAGTVLGKITASGKFKVYDPASVDGSQTVAGILWDDTNATAADKRAAAVLRDAEVNQGELLWFAGATGGQITTGIAGLATIGIIARPSVPA